MSQDSKAAKQSRTGNRANLRRLVLLALFIAITLVMKAIGLGKVPFGPLNLSFLMVPVAVGAILLGPVEGAILGLAFGVSSFYDALSGAGGLTTAFFSISWFSTLLLCVGTRTLMGLCVGLIFRGLRKIDKTKTVCYFVASYFAPFLNTVFFMGYIVLFFYQAPNIQTLVTNLGAANPLHFVILLVGVQGLVEQLVCTLVGGAVSKGVAKAMRIG